MWSPQSGMIQPAVRECKAEEVSGLGREKGGFGFRKGSGLQ